MLATVVGNRPQFIKMLPVSRALTARRKKEAVIHTGQHHDDALSGIFFRELDLPVPDVRLGVTATGHGAMTAELLAGLEKTFIELKPDAVLVYGDTNSTLAAALAAAKLQIPVAHVEAGPRTYGFRLPEEINRRLTDHLSQLLFCPDNASVENLTREGLGQGAHFTGDVMLDSFLMCKSFAHVPAWKKYTQLAKPFILLTLHRPGNVDSPECLEKLYELLERLDQPVFFPVHLRTQKRLEESGLLKKFQSLKQHALTPPMGYLDTIAALTHCQTVITDSGGLQKEAFFAGKPCIVLLDETPWPDLKAGGWQRVPGTLAEISAANIGKALRGFDVPKTAPQFYGDGHAAEKIVDILIERGFI
ncbi:MAG: UDP-N-acetylglucosamine 2-epimerase (non-hydrolyzing) [Pseudomonadota bacterium]|nr:UDP-N-acetylglucosamine 2-epimerase (non-hydrolyzing) [Pseudomonadota bacterium]MDE3038794.1 UDP-N-acetylglucosamine 2-epimerase (non-hydrolyzing) [Pseudomonadota bacterium]